MNEDATVVFSRFAFIFLIYSIISSGYISEVLSCQMQHFMTHNKFARHILGIIMIIVFIMMEGGWSFDKKEDEDHSNDWSSGNVLTTFVIAIGIYMIFLISSKSQLVPNILFFSLTFILYVINTQRSYWLVREKISKELNEHIVNLEIVLLITCICILVYGFVDYVSYQRRSYGPKFDWALFFLGTSQCASLK
jgi:hypothetical protein